MALWVPSEPQTGTRPHAAAEGFAEGLGTHGRPRSPSWDGSRIMCFRLKEKFNAHMRRFLTVLWLSITSHLPGPHSAACTAVPSGRALGRTAEPAVGGWTPRSTPALCVLPTRVRPASWRGARVPCRAELPHSVRLRDPLRAPRLGSWRVGDSPGLLPPVRHGCV